MELLRDAQLLKIVMNVGPCYPKIIKEFVVNFPNVFNDPKSYAVKIPIGFPFEIFGILSSQNNGIVTSESKVNATPSVLKFNYNLFVGKHVDDIVIHTVDDIDETNLGIDDNMLYVAPLSRLVRSHILKVLIHEVKALQEIIDTSIARKSVREGIIKMLSPQSVGDSSTHFVILDFEKDVAHVD